MTCHPPRTLRVRSVAVCLLAIIHAVQCSHHVASRRPTVRLTQRPLLPHPITTTEAPPSLGIASHFRPCGTDDQFARILFPTVPRSGSSMTRTLLEIATGISTGTVFREGGAWNERAHAFVSSCGAVGDCNHVHAPKGTEPIVVKSHYPFLEAKGVAFGNDCVSGILMTVRHPLDNYVA